MSVRSFDVRRLDSSNERDYTRALQVLEAAFRGDSQLVAITGGRASLESAYLRAQLDIGLAEGVVYVGGGGIDDSIDGVIIAYGPDQSTKQEEQTNWSATTGFISVLPSEMQQWWHDYVQPKYSELTSLALGDSDVRRGSWYIRLLAVHPDSQRRGLARRLLEVFKTKADATSKRMCTEVHTDYLVRYFAKNGFRVKGTKTVAGYQGGFPLFCMLREPRP